MTTLTVEIDKDRDLLALQAVLTSMGLNFRLNDDEWGGLSEAEIEGIKAGLNDIEAGRTFPHEQVTAEVDEKIKAFRKSNG